MKWRGRTKTAQSIAVICATLTMVTGSILPGAMVKAADDGATKNISSSESVSSSNTKSSDAKVTSESSDATVSATKTVTNAKSTSVANTTKSESETQAPAKKQTVQVSVQKIAKYATVRNSSYNYKIWKTLDFKQSVSFSQYRNKTLKAVGKVNHYKGATYYLLATTSGKQIGFINATALHVTANPQGSAIADSKYVTIISKSGSIYSDFNGKTRAKLSSNYLKTFKVKYVYHHSNGLSYYSLYNASNKWAGYVKSSAVKTSTHGRLGIGISTNKYVTIFSKNYWLYKTLNWSRYVKSKDVYHYTYHVATEYHANDGETYYRLTNKNGTFRGYVNAKAVHVGKGKQGAWVNYTETVKLKSGAYSIYRTFNWTKTKKQYSSYKNWVLKVKGRYGHINQSTYYSLYTPKGTWIGYINKNAVKKYTAPTKPRWLRPSEDKPYPNLKNYPNAYFSVSQEKQRVYIKSASGKTLYTMICSTGLGHNTPNGWFKIQAERGLAFSGANYWTSWLNHGQYLFHTVIVNHDRSYNVAAAQKLGHKASHGCIRLPVPDAIWIYKNAPVGMRVHIY